MKKQLLDLVTFATVGSVCPKSGHAAVALVPIDSVRRVRAAPLPVFAANPRLNDVDGAETRRPLVATILSLQVAVIIVLETIRHDQCQSAWSEK